MLADEIEFGNPLMEMDEVVKSNPVFEAERDAAAGRGVVLQQSAKQAKAAKKKNGKKKGPGEAAAARGAPGRGRGSAGRGFKGVFDPPGHLLTSYPPSIVISW